MKISYVISVFLGVLFVTSLLGFSGAAVPARVEVRAPDNSVDVPVWHPGDRWSYSAEGEISMQGYTFNGQGDVNFTVNPTNPLDTVTIGDSDYRCYNLIISGQVVFTGSASGTATFTGNIWYRQSDLAYTKIQMNINLNATYMGIVPIVGTMDTTTTFNPPVEECDFPIAQGEVWNISTHSHSDNHGTGALAGAVADTLDDDLDFSYTCADILEGYTVQGKSYKVYHNTPSLDGMNEIYYSPDVGYYVQMTFVFGGFPLNLELKEYVPSPIENRVTVSLSPDTANFGDTVTVNMNLETAVSGGTVVVSVPAVGIEESSTFSGTSFSTTITAPAAMDDSLTTYDAGSFGVVVTVNSVHYGAATLTVKGPDLSMKDSYITVSPADDIIQGDNLTVTVKVLNSGTAESTATSGAMSVGNDNVPFDIPPISAGDSATITLYYVPLGVGMTTITISLNPEQTLLEASYDNNIASVTVNVGSNTPPTVESISPPIDTLFMDEGTEQVFSVNASDGEGDALIYNWSVYSESGVLIDSEFGDASSYTLSLGYTGIFSASSGTLTVKCTVADARPEKVAMNVTTVWTVQVRNVNRLPVITAEGGDVTINEGENHTFSVNVTDPDGDALTYSWTVNGKSVSADGTSFTFVSQYTGENSAGTYTINLTVTDSEGHAYMEWVLTVVNVNRKPAITSMTPEDGSVYKEGDTITLNVAASDPDGDALNYTWVSDVDGSLGSGSSLSTTLSPGTHKITVTVSDGTDQVSQTVTVVVSKKKSSSGGDSGYTDMVPIVVLILAMLALVHKRKKE